MHFRGPIQIKQFAAYNPQISSAGKRGESHGRKASNHIHRHAHAHKKRQQDDQTVDELKKRADMVVATIDGQVVSWVNDYFGSAAAAASVETTAPSATQYDTTIWTTAISTTTQTVAFASKDASFIYATIE